MLNLDAYEVVDLTQPLGMRATVWPGGTPLAVERVSHIKGGGTYSRRIALEEHCGTHLDAPGHVLAGAPLVGDLPAPTLVASARVIDVAAACGENADFTLTFQHLTEHEHEHGPVPTRAVVIAHTGWERHLGTPRYLGVGPSFPGFAPDAAHALVARGVVGLGIDTPGVDAGTAATLPVHHITAAAGIYHLEGLVALHRLPATGACLFIGAPPLEQGSGVPVRVLALVPR